MATLTLSTYKAERNGGFVSIHMNIGRTEPDPFPPRTVEIKRTADAVAARDAYVADVKAGVTTPCVVTMRLARGQRKPPGFDAADGKGFVYVNCGDAA